MAWENTVTLSVIDSGIGIASDKLSTVFEPFMQVDQQLARGQDGVGLGLAIGSGVSSPSHYCEPPMKRQRPPGQGAVNKRERSRKCLACL